MPLALNFSFLFAFHTFNFKVRVMQMVASKIVLPYKIFLTKIEKNTVIDKKNIIFHESSLPWR